MAFAGRKVEGRGSGFFFVGNRLCLDFVNTRVVEGGRSVDLLGDPSDLARWLSEAGVLGAAETEATSKGRFEGTRGRELFERALALRDILSEVVRAVAEDGPVQQRALDGVNALLRVSPGYPQVGRTRDGFEKRFWAEREVPLGTLVPIAESAADLLAEGDFSLVRKCENPECVLHFYDTSKGHARRWCSMSGCGNRMKAQAHYRRRRDAEV